MRLLPIALFSFAGGTAFAQLSSQAPGNTARADEIRELKGELARISARLDALERNGGGSMGNLPVAGPAPAPSAAAAPSPDVAVSPQPAATASAPALAAAPAPKTTAPEATAGPSLNADDERTLGFFRSTTIGLGVDGYYDYNFNQPIGRVNLLRAFVVTSNSFSISQANLIFEHLPTVQERAGGRIDLQFGQATDTLQGSAANELRPQVWRNLFQAYGSYLAPVGSGLRFDFGKFASSLGVEGDYTKDQIAYTRSFLFDYLPYYHMGLRASYDFTPKLNGTYWLVNGANQSEDFNGFKSQGFIVTLKPAANLAWNINYYFGEEQRDVVLNLNPGLPTAPTQPGLPTANITPNPNGREHIFDTYATWNATPRLTLVGEADYVINRTFAESAPGKVAAGAFFFKYALPGNYGIGGRTEYFDDRNGLFSNVPQALKEVTLVADHLVAPGFLLRAEYRRDFSNRRFFLTDVAGALSPSQTTATLGLVYWWGTKQGGW